MGGKNVRSRANIRQGLSMTSDVVVLVAGVIGLTSALALCEAGLNVRINAAASVANPDPWFTSVGSGGFWMPFHIEPETKVRRWAGVTYHQLEALADVLRGCREDSWICAPP